MSLLLHGDCLEVLKSVDDNSVDLIFCDLPYGQTSCKWDVKIDLTKLWDEFMRVKKLNTPLFFTTTTKFGVELIQSAPKKCFFRYDLVFVKSAPTSFLTARRLPMRKHEMIYVFYEKLPYYDLSSHKHKFLKEHSKMASAPDNREGGEWNKDGDPYVKEKHHSKYDPPLPVSVIKDGSVNEEYESTYGTQILPEYMSNNIQRSELRRKYKQEGKSESSYDPPLPTSVLEIKSTRGKHSTEKPIALMKWILKYYSKKGDVVLDPTMGSGSTGVACKEMNRNFIGIEMDAEIYEVAVNRIEI